MVTFFIGVVVTVGVEWLCNFSQSAERNRRRADAKKLLAKNGLTPVLYLSTIGIEDRELRSALDEYAFHGYIIFNSDGVAVGRIVPEVQQAKKHPHLRLVVSNGKPVAEHKKK